MLPSYFDFVHLRQKARLRPDLSPRFLSTLGSHSAQTWTLTEKPGPTYNSGMTSHQAKLDIRFITWLKVIMLASDYIAS